MRTQTEASTRKGWKWVTLADVAKVVTGNTPPTGDARNYGDAIPFVKPTELVDREIRFAPAGLADQALGKARVVPAGAVLVSCIGNLGKTGLAKVPVAFNQQINAVVFNENVVPEFGFYYAQTLKSWLYGESSATTLPIINKGKFQQAPFPLAPIAEQREIVAEIEKQFSRLDEAVANLQRVKANLKRYKASVLKDAVEGRLVPTEAELARREGRNFETGEQLLQRVLAMRRGQWKAKGKYKEPPPVELPMLQEVPDGWTWCGIEHVSVSDKNALKAGPFGSALKKEFYVETGYKIYGQEQVIRGDANYGDYFIDGEKFRELESCAVKPGDVLVSLVGTAGKVLVLPADAAPGIINPRLIKLSLNLAVVLPEYVAYVLQSPVASRFFKAQAHGGTMDILNLGIVKSLPMPFPPIGEQRRIVDEIDRRHSLIRGVEAEVDANLKRAQSLRQATLQAAFSASTVSPVKAKRTEKCEESLHVST